MKKKVVVGMSGGVDSSVAAVLVHKAVGKQLTCVFVDHGLLRKDEGDQVEQVFKRDFDMNLIRVNAQDRFLSKLKGVSDPEKKRKIIGEEFIRVFEEESKKIGHVDFLVQGTIYPDVVESGGTGTSATIKSHHNVGGLPKDMKLGLIEPLRELFKDEVRAVGEELGIPSELVWRQPFPGPGLGVRCLGAITRDRLEAVRESDAILREAARIAAEGVDEDYFRRIRKASFGANLRGLNSFENIAVTLTEGYFHGYDPLRFPEVFESITPEDVAAFLKTNVTAERMVLSRIVPKQ